MLHLNAICGGAALLHAARGFQQLVVDPRTFTYTWSYFYLAAALQVLAGLLLLSPILWSTVRGQGLVRRRWGLVALYVLAGLVLATRQPLLLALARSGLVPEGAWLSALLAGASLNLFGAFLIAVGIVYAFGRTAQPDGKPAERSAVLVAPSRPVPRATAAAHPGFRPRAPPSRTGPAGTGPHRRFRPPA